jgi:glycosidase
MSIDACLLMMRQSFVRRMAAARAVLLAILGAAAVLGSAYAASPTPPAGSGASDEIFYLIFVRSFSDSNGDTKGDLKGIEERLGYLQDLGVTTVVLTPLYLSPFYHSYFATDFSKIDPAYGTEADFRSLVRSLHKRGMKIFIDEEVQYVTADHEWFKDSLNNPNSKYSHYILYNGPKNTQPESGELPTYAGTRVLVATVNMYEPAVLEYQTEQFEHWMNPTGRVGAADGVDGFRIDHMMDNLDMTGKLTGLFARFWTPMFQQLRADNRHVRILAEQADWSAYGDDWFNRGNVDMVYAFPIRGAIVSFDKKQIVGAVTETWRKTPAGKQQLVFIENHDTNRFASEVGGDLRREKLGASLNLLLKGIPLIYYGQELGMEGRQGRWMSDGNDIPVREAFPWTASIGPGMAVWYKDTGAWWTQSPLAKGGYISLESEVNEPGSILSYYKYLIALRKANPELITGDQAIVGNDSNSVFSFVRFDGARRVLVAVNLAETRLTAHVAASDAAPALQNATLRNLITGEVVIRGADGSFAITLQEYGVGIYGISTAN